jgi:hypothetical protein
MWYKTIGLFQLLGGPCCLHLRATELGSGGCGSDWDEEMCQSHRKVAMIGHSWLWKGRGDMSDQPHFMQPFYLIIFPSPSNLSIYLD